MHRCVCGVVVVVFFGGRRRRRSIRCVPRAQRQRGGPSCPARPAACSALPRLCAATHASVGTTAQKRTTGQPWRRWKHGPTCLLSLRRRRGAHGVRCRCARGAAACSAACSMRVVPAVAGTVGCFCLQGVLYWQGGATPGPHPTPPRPHPQTMQISPLCPDAHNQLAAASSSYEEALEHYLRGEAVGLQVRLGGRLLQGCATLGHRRRPSAVGPIGTGIGHALGWEPAARWHPRAHAAGPCGLQRAQVVPPERLQLELDQEDVWPHGDAALHAVGALHSAVCCLRAVEQGRLCCPAPAGGGTPAPGGGEAPAAAGHLAVRQRQGLGAPLAQHTRQLRGPGAGLPSL